MAKRRAEFSGPAPALAAGDLHPLTDEEFALFQTLIEREAGIYLAETKKALLASRLGPRLRELDLGSFLAYYRRVAREGDAEERLRMLDAIVTTETAFFREPRQFRFLAEHLLPDWERSAAARRRPRGVRAWSAGCASGEEPHSLGMVLLDRLPVAAGWEVEVLATDLSTRALARAREAVWPVERAGEIPRHYLRRFMLKGKRSQAGRMKAGPELRSAIRFERLNLNAPSYPSTGTFDLILCRNVLIYFEAAAKARAVDRLLDRLAPGGYLFVGHAESLASLTSRVRAVIPTVYTLAAGRPGPNGAEG